MKHNLAGFVFSLLLVMASFAHAQTDTAPPAPAPSGDAKSELLCPNAQIFGAALINKVCWSCLFPIRMFGHDTVGSTNTAPADASDDKMCVCPVAGDLPIVGFSVGAWFPAYLVEVVRKPYCFPSLFGLDKGNAGSFDSALNLGESAGTVDENHYNDGDFYSWHMYAFPLMEMFQLVELPKCLPDKMASFDVMFMSEVFPHWYDDELAFVVQPEALIFANPVAQAAQLADCPASTADNPIESIFWIAGCWGSHYPITGQVGAHSEATSTSLAMARAMYMISRLGFLHETTGNDVLCEAKISPVVKKEQYKFQQLFPTSESTNAPTAPKPSPQAINTADAGSTENAPDPGADVGASRVSPIDLSTQGGTCCHSYGSSSMRWGEWRNRPGKSDHVYLIWRWTDCCAGVIGGGI